MENVMICQSCEMPMMTEEQFGKNADGSKNEDYCCHCWQSGTFADWCKDLTMEQMAEGNIRFIIEAGLAKTEEEARAISLESLPKLKRWKVS